MCSPKLTLFWLAGMLCLFLCAGNFKMKGCMEAEKQALLKLKHGFIDDDDILSSWKAEVDCCQWKGVSCNNLTGHVTKLNIQVNDSIHSNVYRGDDPDVFIAGEGGDVLQGKIDSSLCELRYLTHLNLSHNDFYGEKIPKCIGSLGQLRELILSTASLVGIIPHELRNLSNLQTLDLSGNDDLVSYNHDWISHLSSLRYLDLSRSLVPDGGLVGTVPHGLRNLSNLQTLDLSGNYLLIANDLEWVSHLSSLRYLGLSHVNLSRAIDLQSSLSRILPSLSELHLDYCSLPQFNSKSFFHMNSSISLKVLSLASNNFDSSILSWVSNISKVLVDLDLQENSLRHIFPSALKIDSLKYLDLSTNLLEHIAPAAFTNTTSLEHLFLQSNELESGMVNSISSMCQLKKLDLYSNTLSSPLSEWIPQLGCVQKSIGFLGLRDNPFDSGPFPDISRFSSLKSLDLSNMNLFGSIPQSFGTLPHLSTLDLSHNNLSGRLSEFVGLSSLESLDLSSNKFNEIPQSFGHLPHLSYLDLSYNNLSGRLPEFVGLPSLEQLDLSNNEFDKIPQPFGHLPHLSTLDLSRNNFSGRLPEFVGFLSLKSLDLSNNNFDEIPLTSEQLSSLVELNLSSNRLKGVICETNLSTLSGLEVLDVSYNSISFNFSSNWVPTFQLEYLYASSCVVGPHFPLWLKYQKELQYLEISNGEISDSIPQWLWLSPALRYLKLSHNKIHGEIPKNVELTTLDLSFNNFSGPISYLPSKVQDLILSNNKFSGSISSSCATEPSEARLLFLDLSNNLISGSLPDCWGPYELETLNLANNNISGRIPNSIGNLESIESIHLNNNGFSGEMPNFVNSSKLELIDFGQNHLNGNLPAWIGHHLPSLIVLRLTDNDLQGSIPMSLCTLQRLQILDISHNSLTGTIPHCLSNLSAMSDVAFPRHSITYYTGDDSYTPDVTDNAMVAWKGNDVEYNKNLRYMVSIDLSCNRLEGEIPSSIVTLVALISLNLSGNHLTGFIPNNMGQMNWLESLDLSCNSLYGEIPTSFSALTFLSYLNLSFNNLSGEIPQTTQLQTFNASSYEGNQGLCGPPLPQCSTHATLDHPLPHDFTQDKEDKLISFGFYVSLILGFIIGFWGVCGSLIAKKSWRQAYFQFFSDINDWTYVQVVLLWAKIKRRFQD